MIQDVHTDKICAEITWLQPLVSDSWWHHAICTQTTWVRRRKERKYYYWHLWRKLNSFILSILVSPDLKHSADTKEMKSWIFIIGKGNFIFKKEKMCKAVEFDIIKINSLSRKINLPSDKSLGSLSNTIVLVMLKSIPCLAHTYLWMGNGIKPLPGGNDAALENQWDVAIPLLCYNFKKSH